MDTIVANVVALALGVAALGIAAVAVLNSRSLGRTVAQLQQTNEALIDYLRDTTETLKVSTSTITLLQTRLAESTQLLEQMTTMNQQLLGDRTRPTGRKPA